eukprot:792542_1
MGDALPVVVLGFSTSNPTSSLSSNPTTYPTSNPTSSPTSPYPSNPTIFPTSTSLPSVHPTQPTRTPTSSPSDVQTPFPSVSSTTPPTVNPIVLTTEKEETNDSDSTKPFKDNEPSNDFVVTAVILILIGAMALVGCGFCIWRRKRVQNNQKMVQKEMQQGAAMVNNNNISSKIIDEDERMENVEDSIDSLYVNKHGNHETTTRCTVDGSNQRSNGVQSMIS